MATKKAAKKTPAKVSVSKSKPLSKSQIYTAIADQTGVAKKQVGAVFDALFAVVEASLTKGNGIVTIPGLVKLKVTKTKARPAREGINPFTKEKVMLKAKPAGKAVRARVLKNLKNVL